jgi:hypothetical protein
MRQRFANCKSGDRLNASSESGQAKANVQAHTTSTRSPARLAASHCRWSAETNTSAPSATALPMWMASMARSALVSRVAIACASTLGVRSQTAASSMSAKSSALTPRQHGLSAGFADIPLDEGRTVEKNPHSNSQAAVALFEDHAADRYAIQHQRLRLATLP